MKETCDKCGEPKRLNAAGVWTCTPCWARAHRGGTDGLYPCGHPRTMENTYHEPNRYEAQINRGNTVPGRRCKLCLLASGKRRKAAARERDPEGVRAHEREHKKSRYDSDQAYRKWRLANNQESMARVKAKAKAYDILMETLRQDSSGESRTA